MLYKGPVEISGVTQPNISKKERIFRFIRECGEEGTDNARIRRATGFPGGTVGSALTILEKEKKIHKKKKPGKRGYTFHVGESGALSPNIKQIRKHVADVEGVLKEVTKNLQTLRGGLNYLEKIVEECEKREEIHKAELKTKIEEYEELEETHLNLLEKIEGLTKD